MKKAVIIVVIVLLVIFLYPKSYISSPGLMTPEATEEFTQTLQKCIGYRYLTNAMEAAADAPGQSLCFGWLVK